MFRKELRSLKKKKNAVNITLKLCLLWISCGSMLSLVQRVQENQVAVLAQIIPREVPGVTLGNVGKNRCRLAASEPQWSGIAEPVLLFTTLLKEKMPQIMFQDMLH